MGQHHHVGCLQWETTEQVPLTPDSFGGAGEGWGKFFLTLTFEAHGWKRGPEEKSPNN